MEANRVSDERLEERIGRQSAERWKHAGVDEDIALDLRDSRAREKALERQLEQVRDSTGRIPIQHVTYEDGPGLTWKDALARESARADKAEAQVAALRAVLEDFRWAAAPGQHGGTSAYPYEAIGEVLADTASTAEEFERRIRREALEEAANLAEGAHPGADSESIANGIRALAQPEPTETKP